METARGDVLRAGVYRMPLTRSRAGVAVRRNRVAARASWGLPGEFQYDDREVGQSRDADRRQQRESLTAPPARWCPSSTKGSVLAFTESFANDRSIVENDPADQPIAPVSLSIHPAKGHGIDRSINNVTITVQWLIPRVRSGRKPASVGKCLARRVGFPGSPFLTDSPELSRRDPAAPAGGRARPVFTAVPAPVHTATRRQGCDTDQATLLTTLH